jgi:hypothetical protein
MEREQTMCMEVSATGNGNTSARIRNLLNKIIDADSKMYKADAPAPLATVTSMLLLAVTAEEAEGAESWEAEPFSIINGVASLDLSS